MEILIKIEQAKPRYIEDFISITGFIEAKYLVDLIPGLDISETNPRTPTDKSHVVSQIINTVDSKSDLFPLMSKGVLIAFYNKPEYTSAKEDNFIDLSYNSDDKDGVLDGGHNLFAIGKYLLNKISSDALNILNWNDLRQAVNKNNSALKEISLKKQILVPIEIIHPRVDDISDNTKRKVFSEISFARNTNIQLSRAALANYLKKFDYIKSVMGKKYQDRVVWQENDIHLGEREIPVDLVIQIIWVVLSYSIYNIDPIKKSEILEPHDIYKFPEECLKVYEKIIDEYSSDPLINLDENMSISSNGTLHNPILKSALDLLREVFDAYDYIYNNFAHYYNLGGGRFGRIKFIDPAKDTQLPFSGEKVYIQVPPFEFIFPVLLSLRNLIGFKKDGTMTWIQKPIDFLECKSMSGEVIFADLTRAIRSTYEANNDIYFVSSNPTIYKTLEAKVNAHIDYLFE